MYVEHCKGTVLWIRDGKIWFRDKHPEFATLIREQVSTSGRGRRGVLEFYTSLRLPKGTLRRQRFSGAKMTGGHGTSSGIIKEGTNKTTKQE